MSPDLDTGADLQGERRAVLRKVADLEDEMS